MVSLRAPFRKALISSRVVGPVMLHVSKHQELTEVSPLRLNPRTRRGTAAPDRSTPFTRPLFLEFASCVTNVFGPLDEDSEVVGR